LAELANLCCDRIEEVLDTAEQASAGSGTKGRLLFWLLGRLVSPMAVAAECGQAHFWAG